MDLDWGRGQGQKQRFTRVVMRNAPPGELGTDKERSYVLMHTHTPVDERNHFWRWIVNCKKDRMSGGDPKDVGGEGVSLRRSPTS